MNYTDNLPAVNAVCAKCGREFITVPVPGQTDPYRSRRAIPGWGDDEPCGGELKFDSQQASE